VVAALSITDKEEESWNLLGVNRSKHKPQLSIQISKYTKDIIKLSGNYNTLHIPKIVTV